MIFDFFILSTLLFIIVLLFGPGYDIPLIKLKISLKLFDQIIFSSSEFLFLKYDPFRQIFFEKMLKIFLSELFL